MASGAGSRDPDQAARVLGVPADATREAVEQAYRDLREVWNPERFGQDERLRKKAEDQLREIEDAYIVLRRRSLPDDPLYEIWSGKPHKGHAKPAPARVPRESKSTSLVDDFFAVKARPKRKFPTWAAVLAAILLCVFGAWWMSRRANEKKTAEQVTSAPPMAPPPTVNATPQVPNQTAAQSGGPPGDTAKLPPAAEPTKPESPPIKSGAPATTLAGPATEQRTAPPKLRPADRAVSDETRTTRKPPVQSGEPSVTERLPGEKPQLTRGVEDEQAEAARRMEAFNLLRQKSEVARRLIDGDIGELRFIEWNALPRDSGQTWIDVVAIASGQNIHFIWATDPSKQTVRPLSQAARDLEATLAKH